MKKLTILFFVYFFTPSVETFAQITYSGPAVIFTYDNVGNRLVRRMETICVGPGCPPIESEGSAGLVAGDTDPVKRTELTNPAKDDAGEITTRAENNIAVYPNPVSEVLFIENKNWKEDNNATIVIYDMSGKVVLQKESTHAKSELNFKEFVPGTYVIYYCIKGSVAEGWRIIKN